jgi:hypothetical protein
MTSFEGLRRPHPYCVLLLFLSKMENGRTNYVLTADCPDVIVFGLLSFDVSI